MGPAAGEYRVLAILVGTPRGISEPGIGPGRPAPEITVPEPVDSPAGVTPLVSDLAPDIPEPEPTDPIMEGVLSLITLAVELLPSLDVPAM